MGIWLNRVDGLHLSDGGWQGMQETDLPTLSSAMEELRQDVENTVGNHTFAESVMEDLPANITADEWVTWLNFTSNGLVNMPADMQTLEGVNPFLSAKLGNATTTS